MCRLLSPHSCWHSVYLFSSTARPTIVSLRAPDTNTEGMRFELVCTFTGVPPPTIRWEKDGSVFVLGGDRRIINSTGRSALEIGRLLVSDAGVYNCSVSNVGGMATRSVLLEVRGEEISFASDVYYTLTCLSSSILLSWLYGFTVYYSCTTTT